MLRSLLVLSSLFPILGDLRAQDLADMLPYPLEEDRRERKRASKPEPQREEGTLHWSFGDGSGSRVYEAEAAGVRAEPWWSAGENGAWSEARVERANSRPDGAAEADLTQEDGMLGISFGDPCAHDITVRMADALGRWASYSLQLRAERGVAQLPFTTEALPFLMIGLHDHGSGVDRLLLGLPMSH